MITSDLNLDVSKFGPVSEAQTKFNEYLESVTDKAPGWYEIGPAKYRQMRKDGKTALPAPVMLEGGKAFAIPSREQGRDIPCRLMMPEEGHAVNGVYMHIHGGGWVLMDHESSDPLLKLAADAANLAVISIGYRLAPEHPFPSGPEDCYDAATWLVDHAEAELGAPLKFIGGESAGGHLSVLSVLHLLDTKPQFKLSGVVLNFGVYDLSFLPQARNFHKPLFLSPKLMQQFVNAFLPGMSPEERRDPSISPFFRDLNGMKLPPALFTVGTEDCLLDDSIMMALKWQMTGAETITKIFNGAPHGYIAFPSEKVESAGEFRKIFDEFLKTKI